MQTVGAYEAKTKLGELLTMVGKGESFTITKYGLPAAILTQPLEPDISNVEGTIRAIRGQRAKFAQAFKQVSVKALIEEGRK
jgi:antitoxin (DNA-binding transcriptional repressor) of toxin-antitoxin stability system